MVRTSGIREKFRSNALKELASRRGNKRTKQVEVNKDEKEEEEDSEDEEQVRLEQERRLLRAKTSKESLLSILPQPKNSNAFGPTIRLDKLLKMPERADEVTMEDRLAAANDDHGESGASRVAEDGMIEVDVSKVVGDVSQTLIKELTVEKAKPVVIVPKGKERQKNQITYLAQLGKATELERKEQAAQSRINKAAARSKYGW